MVLRKLKLNYFGRFHEKEIELKPGLNIIYGDNEAGKSTLHTFIKGMFFGIERLRGRGSATKDDLYNRYLPWNYPGAFGGSMDILQDQKEYRIQRSFHAADKNLMIFDLQTGREIRLKDGHISEMVPGLTESFFKNTISIEQLKAATDTELAAQVHNYITNLSIAKSKEVNVIKAVKQLTDQKKTLESMPYPAELGRIREEIAEGVRKEEKMEELTHRLQELLPMEKELHKRRETYGSETDLFASKQMEELPAMMEKYARYEELTKQNQRLEQRREGLKKSVETLKQKAESADHMIMDIKEAENLQEQLQEYEKRKSELQLENGKALKQESRHRLLCIIPAIALILILLGLSVPMSGSMKTGMGMALAVAFIAVFLLFIMAKRSKARQQDDEDRWREYDGRISRCSMKRDRMLREYEVASVKELSARKEEPLRYQLQLQHEAEQVEELKERENELMDQLDELYDSIMNYMRQFIDAQELSKQTIQSLNEEIRRRRQEVTRQQNEINRQYDLCKIEIEKIRWEIADLEGNEAQLVENREKYKDLEYKQRENETELAAIKLALNTIQELSVQIHDSFGRQLNRRVSLLAADITGQKYTDIKLDERLDMKVGRNNNYIMLDKLSAGTIDQMYFALRLSAAELLLGKNEMPLLLDDSFALYDERRLTYVLKQISQRCQCVLFTCHRREQELLEGLGLPYHLVNLSGNKN